MITSHKPGAIDYTSKMTGFYPEHVEEVISIVPGGARRASRVV